MYNYTMVSSDCVPTHGHAESREQAMLLMGDAVVALDHMKRVGGLNRTYDVFFIGNEDTHDLEEVSYSDLMLGLYKRSKLSDV